MDATKRAGLWAVISTIAVLPPAYADDLGEALAMVEDTLGGGAVGALAGVSARDDQRVMAMLVSRNVTSDRALDSYDCATESIVDGENTLRSSSFDRWSDRACHELRFADGEPPPGYRALGERVLRPAELADLAYRAGAAADVPEAILEAIVRFESGGWPGAIGDDGALGLMQIRPEVARKYPHANLLEPGTNLRIGARHLRALWDRFGELEMALAAFRAGEARVAELGDIPSNERRTLWFVREVRRIYRAQVDAFPYKDGAADIAYVWTWTDDRETRRAARSD